MESVAMKNQATQTIQVYQSSVIKRNSDLAKQIRNNIHDSILCDRWDAFNYLVSLYDDDYFPMGLLRIAVKHSRYRYIEAIIGKVETEDEIEAVMNFAVITNRCEALRIILEFTKGKPKCISSGNGFPLLVLAIKRNLVEITKIIIEKAYFSDLFRPYDDTDNPEYIAGFRGSVPLLTLLLGEFDTHAIAMQGAYDGREWTTLEWVVQQCYDESELLDFIKRIIEDNNVEVLEMLEKNNKLVVDEELYKLSQDNWRTEWSVMVSRAYKKQKSIDKSNEHDMMDGD